MRHRNEQPTLFELTACDQCEPPRRLPAEHVAPDVTPRSDLSAPEANGCRTEPGVFRAVSPWAFCGDISYVAHKLNRCFVPRRSRPTPQHKLLRPTL
jgi:hypothetical protein